LRAVRLPDDRPEPVETQSSDMRRREPAERNVVGMTEAISDPAGNGRKRRANARQEQRARRRAAPVMADLQKIRGELRSVALDELPLLFDFGITRQERRA